MLLNNNREITYKDHLEILSYKGKEIVYLNLENVDVVREKEKIINIIGEAKNIVKQYPLKSVLTITNLINTGFSKDITNAMIEYAQSNTPFLIASAVVGLSGIQKAGFNYIKNLTSREFYLTDSVENAKEWLINQCD